MENFEEQALEQMVLAPYVQKSTALRGKYRYVGGNQFRHAFGTFAILLDYHYMDPVLLKASLIHDIFEDVQCVSKEEIIHLDADGPKVYELVREVTKRPNESKDEYLERLLEKGCTKAKILKCADRISNLTDLHLDTFDRAFVKKYIRETREYVIPMAEEVNKNMLIELTDLVKRRESSMRYATPNWPMRRVENKEENGNHDDDSSEDDNKGFKKL
jgi:(p)ppGpp synthase/HD superfamily hydrolase